MDSQLVGMNGRMENNMKKTATTEQILESLKHVLGQDKYGEFVNTDLQERIKEILLFLMDTKSIELCKKMMRQSGSYCAKHYNRTWISQAISLSNKGMSLVDFIDHVNKDIWGEMIYEVKGQKVYITYKTCVGEELAAKKDVPEIFCEWIAGWQEGFFTEVYDRKVDVTVMKSESTEGNNCEFEINLY